MVRAEIYITVKGNNLKETEMDKPKYEGFL